MDERIVCKIDGIETEVDEISGNASNLVIITEDGNEYRLFKCHDDAKSKARAVYENMDNDELSWFISQKDSLARWRRGETFDDWLGETIDAGAYYATHDGIERTFESNHEELCDYELAYRIK